jgi:hypothetical protein
MEESPKESIAKELSQFVLLVLVSLLLLGGAAWVLGALLALFL